MGQGVADSPAAADFDAGVWQAVLVATRRVKADGSGELSCTQVLLALLEQRGGVTERLLGALGVDLVALYNQLYQFVPAQPRVRDPGAPLVLSVPLAGAIADARRRGQRLRAGYVTSTLLLAGLTSAPGDIAPVLQGTGVTQRLQALLADLDRQVAATGPAAEIAGADLTQLGPFPEQGTPEERREVRHAVEAALTRPAPDPGASPRWSAPPSPAAAPAGGPVSRRRMGLIVGATAGVVLLVAASVVGVVAIIRSRQQVVVIRPVAAVTYGDSPLRISARASSGLPVKLSVASGPCTVAGDLLTVRGAGTCRVKASQGGEDGWHTPSSTTTSIQIARANQTIDFGALPAKTHGDPPFDVSAKASSGQPVTFTAAGGCGVAGSTVTIATGGPCTVTARQDGTGDYLPATPVTQSVNVAPIRLDNGRVLVDAGFRNGLGKLTIQNGQGRDAVAVLTTADNKPVFSVSIQAQQTYVIDNIRDGTYNVFFELGSDWDDKSGSFNLSSSRTRFQDPFVFQTVPIAGGVQYDTVTVTLQPVAGGTAATSPVPPDQFPPVR